MEQIIHPSAYIDQKDVDIIREEAARAEAAGMLTQAELAIVYRENWFKLLVPEVYTGKQITLPDLVRLQEAISWADGSLGWTVTLCSGAGWFGGFIDPAIAHRIFNDGQVCLAGSGAVDGVAEITDEGFTINGTWKYASGAYHATHFTANCTIKKNGDVVLNNEKTPSVFPFIIDRKDVTLLPTWKYIGMVATGSHSFQVKNVRVTEDRCFTIDPAYALIGGKLYQYPFLQLAEATLAVNLSGIAMHFIDCCAAVFEEKKKQPRLTDTNRQELNTVFIQETDKLQTARDKFFMAVTQLWNENEYSADKLLEVSQTSRVLAKQALTTVDVLYPYCGLLAAAPDTEINRAWRDIHIASQHALLTFAI